jgi:hypothetical protein
MRGPRIATGYGWMSGVEFLAGARDLSLHKRPDRLRPSFLSDGYLGVKRPWHEAEHSAPSSAEVKNGGAIPQLPNTSSWRGAYLYIKRKYAWRKGTSSRQCSASQGVTCAANCYGELYIQTV